MADKVTLLELHLHAEDNEFTSDMQLSSDIGDLLRRRLGLGSGSAEETETAGPVGTETSVEPDTSSGTLAETTADGGDTVQVDEESETGGAVVEIDENAGVSEDEGDGDSSGGRSKTKMLFVLIVLVGLALLAKRYLDADDLEDEFADEFEEL